jgi:hypothetical protein
VASAAWPAFWAAAKTTAPLRVDQMLNSADGVVFTTSCPPPMIVSGIRSTIRGSA